LYLAVLQSQAPAERRLLILFLLYNTATSDNVLIAMSFVSQVGIETRFHNRHAVTTLTNETVIHHPPTYFRPSKQPRRHQAPFGSSGGVAIRR
jgi:hypothetical protein